MVGIRSCLFGVLSCGLVMVFVVLGCKEVG